MMTYKCQECGNVFKEQSDSSRYFRDDTRMGNYLYERNTCPKCGKEVITFIWWMKKN